MFIILRQRNSVSKDTSFLFPGTKLNLKLNLINIPSGEINNIPLLQSVAKLKKKIILSTGMSNLKEVKNAIDILVSNGLKKKQISIFLKGTRFNI